MYWRQIRRSKVSLLILLAALLCCCGARPQVPPQEALVVEVGDGDTVIIAGGRKVRLLGIDAPELEKEGRPADFLAHKAKAELARLINGQRLRLEYDELRYDQYGRLLAYLFLPDGSLVNAEMVRQGLAKVYIFPPNTRYQDRLLAAQREALEARRGLWQQALAKDEPYYIGNKSSLRFHRPDCPGGRQTAPGNRVQLESPKEAYLKGYSPCRMCKP
ncbi:MAG: thermonuclease family protein [Deltaproteobacteria bacterium]|nr:thermonuclease family protein [Deltaproteobacteria bacterium]